MATVLPASHIFRGFEGALPAWEECPPHDLTAWNPQGRTDVTLLIEFYFEVCRGLIPGLPFPEALLEDDDDLRLFSIMQFFPCFAWFLWDHHKFNKHIYYPWAVICLRWEIQPFFKHKVAVL